MNVKRLCKRFNKDIFKYSDYTEDNEFFKSKKEFISVYYQFVRQLKSIDFDNVDFTGSSRQGDSHIRMHGDFSDNTQTAILVFGRRYCDYVIIERSLDIIARDGSGRTECWEFTNRSNQKYSKKYSFEEFKDELETNLSDYMSLRNDSK